MRKLFKALLFQTLCFAFISAALELELYDTQHQTFFDEYDYYLSESGNELKSSDNGREIKQVELGALESLNVHLHLINKFTPVFLSFLQDIRKTKSRKLFLENRSIII